MEMKGQLKSSLQLSPHLEQELQEQKSSPQLPSSLSKMQPSFKRQRLTSLAKKVIRNIPLATCLCVTVVALFFLRHHLRDLDVPEVNITQYLGPGNGDGHRDNVALQEFKIDYGPTEIEELRAILGRRLRLQPPIDDVGFTYGFNSKVVQPLVDYWRNTYLVNWSERQEYLNQFKQFKTQINGLNVHFIHEKPKNAKAGDDVTRMGILMLHGWPGSVREFYDIIPMLTSSSDGITFEVVAPSLVGFGFSDAATKKGFSSVEMAIVMRNLMIRLGFTKFIIQGGDWGSAIGAQIATLFPAEVRGFHSNLCLIQSPKAILKHLIASIYPPIFIERENYEFHFPIGDKLRFMVEETGYFHLQATKPDTIGIALSNNPIGLAVYILEKFSTGIDTNNRLREDGGLMNSTIELDALLDNVMIYYLSNSITSSIRLYYEESKKGETGSPNFDRIPTQVPMACIRFKHDLSLSFAWQLRDKFPNLKQDRYVHKGGHFAAMEFPGILYEDFRDFVRSLN